MNNALMSIPTKVPRFNCSFSVSLEIVENAKREKSNARHRGVVLSLVIVTQPTPAD